MYLFTLWVVNEYILLALGHVDRKLCNILLLQIVQPCSSTINCLQRYTRMGWRQQPLGKRPFTYVSCSVERREIFPFQCLAVAYVYSW